RSRSISGLLLHELGSQQSPHGPPGLRKVRSGGPFGNLERLRDLPVPPPFQVVKHEHLALNLGKLLQRIEQPIPHPRTDRFPVRTLSARHAVDRLQWQGLAHAGVSDRVARAVPHDLEEPRRESLRTTAIFRALELDQERILANVFL